MTKKETIQQLRDEFCIPSSMTDKEILDSLDRMLEMNSIEIEIALDEFRKSLRSIHKNGKRYVYPTVSESDMW